jgi:hypothetical protein
MMTAVVVMRVSRDWSRCNDNLLDVVSVRAAVLLWSREEAHLDLFREMILDILSGSFRDEGCRCRKKRMCA